MEIEDSYPPCVDFNDVIGKVRFFLGDHWIDIGLIKCTGVVENGRYFCEVDFPDVDLFMENQIELDDGSEDWAIWGCRVN